MLVPYPIPYTGSETEANAILLLCILVWSAILVRMILNSGKKQAGRLFRWAVLYFRQIVECSIEIHMKRIVGQLRNLYGRLL